MKKDRKHQGWQRQRILGRILAQEFGEEEMRLVTGACVEEEDQAGTGSPVTTALVTGMGCEDR